MITSASSPKLVFNTIQLLRGLAAILVVFYHLTLGYEKRGQELIAGGLFQHGFAGVDLFFVISGFVIMHTSHRYFSKPDYLGTFISKRAIRIFPVYWVTLAFIVGGILLIEFVTKTPIVYLPTSWSLILSSLLLLPYHPNINGVTWSLSFELYYYSLFSLLIVSRKLWPIVLTVLALSGMAIVNPALFTNSHNLLAFLFSPYNLEFAAGVLAWWIVQRYKLSSTICFLLLGIAVVWLLVNDGPLVSDAAMRAVLYGISSFLILLSFTGLELDGWFKPSLINRQLMKVGDASFLIYMTHFSFMPFYGQLMTPFEDNMVVQNVAALLFTTVITVVCIHLHTHFEAPLVKKLNQLSKSISPRLNNG
jgi:exopolysaccharide production protein ExoZ